MSFVITKKVGRIGHGFTYWWNQDKKRWEGLKNNATLFKDNSAINDAISTMIRLNLYDKSVYCNINKKLRG